MSRIPKLLQNISKLAMPTALRAPTLTPIPEKTRKYTDVVQSIPKPGEFIEQNYSPLTSADLQDVADEEEFVLLEKVTKECVLLVCAYNQYLDHFTGEFRDKLEFMDRVQELNELLTLDKPVKKKLLHDVCPELFTYEIICKNSPIPLEEKYKHLGMLPEEKQKMIEQEKLLDNATTEITMVSYNENRSQIARISPPKIPTPENSKHRTKAFTVWDREDPNFYKFLHMERYSIYEMYQRHYYVWEQIKTTFLESAEIIAKYREKLGSVPAALSFIRLKGDKRNLEEQKVIDGIAYLQRLLADHEEYTDEYREVMFKNQMAIFPMPKWLHDESVLQIEDMYNNHFVSQEIYTKVLGIPDNSGRDQREREIRAQKARDAMALDAKDRKEAFKLINSSQGDEILVRRDLNMKDEQLIRKMNYLTETIEVKKPKDPVPDYKNKFDPKKFVFSGERLKSSGEGELMIDTILKMLYLNNSDPSTYDVEFWADYFNMRPQHLKNIFYNISYPVLAEKEPVGKLSFIEVPRKKEIFDIFQDKQRQEMNQEIRK